MSDDLTWNGFIKEDADDFADAAIRLYEEEAVWKRCQQNGFELLEAKYQRAPYVALFESYFFAISNDLHSHRAKNFIGLMLLHHSLASTKYMSKWIEEKNNK
jgi:hypothetical protein